MNARRRLAASLIIAVAWAHWAPAAAATGQELAEAAGHSLIGTAAPPLVLQTIDGETIDLGKLYGRRAVYLKFWATWCVPCRQQMPHFEHVYESEGSDLVVIAVNTGFNDSIDAVRAYRSRLGIKMPIVIDDGSLAAAFGLRVTPQHIVIGRDGRVDYVGHLADARLDAALAAARAGPARTASVSSPSNATASGANARHHHVGDTVPEQSPETLDGGRFRLRDPHDPRPLVLVFLSPWCESYLASSRPAMSKDCRRMRDQVSALSGTATVRWLGVASGLWATADDLRDYRTKYGIKIPMTLDESGALFRSFGISQVPVALVADKDGRVVGDIEGDALHDPAALQTAIRAL